MFAYTVSALNMGKQCLSPYLPREFILHFAELWKEGSHRVYNNSKSEKCVSSTPGEFVSCKMH